jgi:dihydroorotase
VSCAFFKGRFTGGITSIEQPNTIPNGYPRNIRTKIRAGRPKSYELFLYDGATNDNLEVLKTNPKNVAGIKIF